MRGEFLAELLEADDGHFLVDSVDGRAILTVHSPGKKGKSVRVPDVIARLNLFGVRDFDKNEIETVVQDADGQGHDVGVFPPPESKDARITIQISDDKMDAWAL